MCFQADRGRLISPHLPEELTAGGVVPATCTYSNLLYIVGAHHYYYIVGKGQEGHSYSGILPGFKVGSKLTLLLGAFLIYDLSDLSDLAGPRKPTVQPLAFSHRPPG